MGRYWYRPRRQVGAATLFRVTSLQRLCTCGGRARQSRASLRIDWSGHCQRTVKTVPTMTSAVARTFHGVWRQNCSFRVTWHYLVIWFAALYVCLILYVSYTFFCAFCKPGSCIIYGGIITYFDVIWKVKIVFVYVYIY